MTEKFLFDITLAKDSHLTGNKLKKAIDDYHYLTPGTTKREKSKTLEDTQPEQDGVSYEQDDRTNRHKIGTRFTSTLEKSFMLAK